MKQNSGGDGDNGEIGKVDIQIDATCEVVEKDITIAPGEEEPLPEPNPEPSPSRVPEPNRQSPAKISILPKA